YTPLFRSRLVAETVLEQGLVQENAGVIPRERPACSVRAMHAGREAHDQQARVDVPEWPYRAAVVVRMPVLHTVEKPGEPRTQAAILVENAFVHRFLPDIRRAHSSGSSMCRITASPKPRVPTSVAPGISWSSSCSTSFVPCGRALRRGRCMASRRRARSNVSALLAIVFATPFTMKSAASRQPM